MTLYVTEAEYRELVDPLYVDDEPWPLYPQPRPDHRWLLVLAVVVLLGLYRALRKENGE